MNSRDSEVLEAFRDEGGELLGRLESGFAELERRGPDPVRIAELERTLHTLKGAAAACGLAAIVEGAHALEGLCARLRAGEEAPPGELSDRVQGLITEYHHELGADLDEGLVRVGLGRVDAVDASLGELAVLRLQAERGLSEQLMARREVAEVTTGLRRLSLQLRRLQRQLGAPQLSRLEGEAAQLERKLSRGLQQAYRSSRRAAMVHAQQGIVLGGLEDAAHRLRMVAIGGAFEQAARAARLAARELGKEVEVTIRGANVELDRATIHRLREPLLHLARNAIAHGIEDAAEREAQGKGAVGRLLLQAESDGEVAILQVGDDGAGIDLAALRERLPPEVELQEDDLLATLTRPGFSTRDSADEVSGRGLGLDAVAARVSELDGRLELETQPGLGAVFRIEVPIAATTQRGLVVRAGSELFALPFEGVERVLRLPPAAITEVEGRPAARVEDQRLALSHLRELLQGELPDAPEGLRQAVLLQRRGQRLALEVDDVVGEQPLLIKPLGAAFRAARTYVGGAVLADHDVLPVLRIDELFRLAATHKPRPLKAAPPERERPRAGKPRILVVDDSVTMRLLARRLLEDEGYEVELACDGEEGRARFEAQAFDLIVTDLEMQPLDGIGLCEAVRVAARRSETPILVVTAVIEEGMHRRALEAGADGLILKSTFAEGPFIAEVRRLCGAVGG